MNELNETMEDIASTDVPDDHVIVEALDKPPAVLTPDGELVPLSEFQAPAVSWLDSDPEQLRKALARRSENRQSVIGWIWDNLVDGTDFGRIHVVKNCDDQKRKACTNPNHFSKPSLWKPGAEKIVGMLNMRAEWPELVDTLDAATHPDAKTVALRCVLHDQHGNVVSEGAGARSLEREYFDLNKAIKMAKKSSLIDAVLNAAGLSEVFTQDAEDRDETAPDAHIDATGQKMLTDVAERLFGDAANEVLTALARRRFNFSDGDWTRIPAWRLQDAIRSLEEKAQETTT
jgi:hypothetical protein